jgi:hypothetical protein
MNTDLVWRIFENGNEILVKNFIVTVPMYGEMTVENGVEKWNVCCLGTMSITDNVATIQ